MLPPIKLEPFTLCLFGPNWTLEAIYATISLAFDSCAFITTVVSAYMSLPPSARKLGSTGVMRTVMQDATIYFVMIFTSHLIFTFSIFLQRVCHITSCLGHDWPNLTHRTFFLVTASLEVNTCGVSSFRIHPLSGFINERLTSPLQGNHLVRAT